MEPTNLTCKFCHQPIRETDFFCANCGKKIKDKPLSTSIWRQIYVIVASILLPPFGLIWAFKYLGQNDAVSKRLGWAIVVVTAISLVVMVKLTIDTMNNINALVNKEMQWIQNYY